MTDRERLSAELKDELEVLIAAGVERAFRDIGLNHEEVFELRKDLTFLREWRLTCDKVRIKGAWTMFALLMTGAVSLMILGYRHWLGQ